MSEWISEKSIFIQLFGGFALTQILEEMEIKIVGTFSKGVEDQIWA